MKLKIQERSKKHIKAKHRNDELIIAKKFSDAVVKEFKDKVKSVILGRKPQEISEHLINVYVILDDMSYDIHKGEVENYMHKMKDLIKKISEDIQVHTLKLSKYWNLTREMKPEHIEYLRDGYAVYDVGFFEPLQTLLFKGRVKPSYESMGIYFIRAPETLKKSKDHIKQAVMDLYWAVMDSAQAALMRHGELSPTPAHTSEMLEKVFVEENLLERKYLGTADKFYHITKGIEHNQIQEITGKQFDDYFKEAIEFVKRMRKLMSE